MYVCSTYVCAAVFSGSIAIIPLLMAAILEEGGGHPHRRRTAVRRAVFRRGIINALRSMGVGPLYCRPSSSHTRIV